MTRYVHYVAYMSITDGRYQMTGSTEVTVAAPITTIDQVREIEQWLSRQKHTKLLVTGISFLRTEGVPAAQPAVPAGG